MTSSRWTPQDLPYAAGFMDGEGTFILGWLKKAGRNRTLTVAVSAGNTNRPVLEWMKVALGGNVYPLREHTAANHQVCFRWRMVGGTQVKRFCEANRPYLKIKSNQAALLIAAADSLAANHRRPPTDEQIVHRQHLYKELKQIHHSSLSGGPIDRASDMYTIRVIR